MQEVVVTKDIAVKFSGTSKGNQAKWFKDGYWIKADKWGYEGLAEELVSILESCIRGFSFTPYKTVKIKSIVDKDTIDYYTGCISPTFLNVSSESFISFRSLYKSGNCTLTDFKQETVQESFLKVVNTIFSLTNLDVSTYLAYSIFLDAITCNEDRHPMNLGVIFNGTSFRLAPVFDNGLSLLSDIKLYKYENTVERNISRVEYKPFSKFCMKNLDALRSLGFTQLVIDYTMLCSKIKAFHSNYYSVEANNRAKQVLSIRLKELEGIAWLRV